MGDEEDGLFAALVPDGLLRMTPSFRLSRLEVGSSSSRKRAHRGGKPAPRRCAGAPPERAPAQLAHRGVVALGQLLDENRPAPPFYRPLPTSARVASCLAILMLFSNGIVEEFGLRVTRLLRPQSGCIDAVISSSPKRDGAAGNVPEAEQEPQEGGLTLPGRPVMPHDLLFWNIGELRSYRTSHGGVGED